MRRRTFFGMVGAGAAAAALPGALTGGTSERGASIASSTRTEAPNIDFLLAPLVGRSLSGGFRVGTISPIDRGAVTVTLVRTGDGARAVVQVFRRSSRSEGLATTRWLDLRWMNGADGEEATPEAGGVAVMTLASRIRRVEAASARAGVSREQRAALRELSTIEQRIARYGAFEPSVGGTERA
jgi:hypothetical protein